MKILFLCNLVILAGCYNTKTNSTKQVKNDSSISVNIEINKKIEPDDTLSQIVLCFNNKSIIEKYIGDPNCLINSEFELFENNVKLPMEIKIHPDLKCSGNLVLIGANDKKTITFNYPLNRLFILKPKTKYILRYKYYGIISNIKNYYPGYNKSFLSCEVNFEME